jgi:hypothetical protein
MFVGDGAARRVLGVFLHGGNFHYPCVLRESDLPPTGTVPSEPGRESRELSLEVETDGARALLGLWRLTTVRFALWRSSSPASTPL